MSLFSQVITPSHGKYIGASSVPMNEWARKPGEKLGSNWRLRNTELGRSVRSIVYDTNYWKSFVFARLTTAMGNRGSLSLFGENSDLHHMFADQLCSEYRVRTIGRGRECDEWKRRPECPDNHLLDCVVGTAVAASLQGVTLWDGKQRPALMPTTKNRVSFAALQQEKLRAPR
jgi:hypothetical protein